MKRFFQFLFMPCEGYTQLMSTALDSDLPRIDRIAVRLHALYCKGCRRYRMQITQMRRWMRSLDGDLQHATDMKLSTEARERMRAALSPDDGTLG